MLAVDVRNGRTLRRLTVEGLEGVDTESLAVGRCERSTRAWCIYIGDIGDNTAARDSITVHRVREPSLRGNGPISLAGDRVVWQYPDGPRDAEALLAGADGTFGVITKASGRTRRGAARLYMTTAFADATLEKGPRIRLPPPAVAVASLVLGSVVTGGDAVDGRVVLRTYDAIYEFIAPRPASALRDFPAWPVIQVRSPSEGQGEAIAYGADGCALFTVSEGSGAITLIPCRGLSPSSGG